MQEYIFDNNVKLLVGDKAIYNLPYELAQLNCKRVLLLSDEISYRVGNWNYVKNIFKSQNIEICATYRKIQDVATNKDCERIAINYKAGNCDCIIAVGKKAAIMAAKGAKILLTEDQNYISHYAIEGIDNFAVRNVPLIVVPTNLASGFEISNFVRISDLKNNKIYEFDTKYAESNIVVVDSVMTDTLPPKSIATYGLYALALSIECFAQEDSTLISKIYADVAIKLVFEYLEKSILKNAEKVYRTKIMEAVVLAGAAYSMLRKQTLAVISDVISDRYHANYSNIFAILFRQYLKKQELSESFGYSLNSMISENDYALVERDKRSERAIFAIESLYDKVNEYVDFNSKLSDFNIPEEDLDDIAKTVADNCKAMEEESILTLLNESY